MFYGELTDLTLRLDVGTSKIYQVPYHANFNVNEEGTSYDKITKGMKISVTAVKTEGVTAESSKAPGTDATTERNLVIMR